MEEKIKVLGELQEYCALRSIGLVMNIDDNDEWTKFVTAISDIIDSYRTLEDQVEELKNLANNKQWISPCYVAENYIAKEKVDEKIEKYKKLGNEFYEKFLETNKTDIDIHDAGLSCDAKVQALQELKEG